MFILFWVFLEMVLILRWLKICSKSMVVVYKLDLNEIFNVRLFEYNRKSFFLNLKVKLGKFVSFNES